MGRIAGIVYVKVDGRQLEILGGVEAPLNEMTREMQSGPNGPVGHSEKVRVPFLKVDAGYTADFPLDILRNRTDLTLTAEWPNGKVYTLSDAMLVGDADVKSDDGSAGLEFNGLQGRWS